MHLAPSFRLAAVSLALLGAVSLARADVIYQDPLANFVAVANSVSYDGWNQLNRPGLGCADTACSTAALVAGIQANTWTSGDAVLRRTSGDMYPAGSGIYGAGTLQFSDSTLAGGITTLVLQSFVNNFGADYAPTLSFNGGTQALSATSVVVDANAPAYRTYSWDLSGLGALQSYSLNVGFEFAQAIAFQVDQVSAVPEAGSTAMMLAGLAGLAFVRLKRRAD